MMSRPSDVGTAVRSFSFFFLWKETEPFVWKRCVVFEVLFCFLAVKIGVKTGSKPLIQSTK